MGETLSFVVRRMTNASNDALWHVLGDFGTEHRWTKSLDHCERDTDIVDVGTIRTCKLPRALMGRTTVREELTEYEPGRALAYRLEGPAGPFASASSRWSTSPGSDGGTVMSVDGFFTVRNRAAAILVWPLVRPMLRRLTGRVMAELEGFVTDQSDGPRS
jgi:Polyketide cyclase / dehydrase and lipid transport